MFSNFKIHGLIIVPIITIASEATPRERVIKHNHFFTAII
jgi:hypothetical protein